jgi:AraC family transcriptional activator FtrA
MIKIMPIVRDRPGRTVAALLHDGACTFELGIVAEIFGLPRPEMGAGWYQLITVAESAGPLRASGGLKILPEAGLEALAESDMIVVPGWPIDGTRPSSAVREALEEAHERGARIASICSGAFLLAACGLLAGKRAATHWLYADRLRELHPDVCVDADVLYVDEGQILTSAGSAAGVDLLLHIVRQDFGANAANEIARRLIMPAHRDGGQAQFIPRPVPVKREDRLAPVLDMVRANPADEWSILRMAREAAMSTRTFIRRFRDATGMAPGDWVIAVRTEAARFLLETEAATLEDIAAAAGFGSVATLRHHFRTRIGLPPAAYRARFSAHGATSAAPG